jgi:hypothetical protein
MLRGRRPRATGEAEPPPNPVTITRVMAIAAEPFEDEDQARDWLERCRPTEEERRSVVADAIAVVNRAIQAHRIAAADPFVREVSRRDAARTRVGYGSGDDLVHGRWVNAYELPPVRREGGRRREMLAPQEQVAGVLGGKSRVWPSEDLALRARLDLDHGRPAQAALQLEAALAALESERGEDRASVADAIAAALANRARVREAAATCLEGDPPPAEVETIAEALALVERALRRRRHAGG